MSSLIPIQQSLPKPNSGHLLHCLKIWPGITPTLASVLLNSGLAGTPDGLLGPGLQQGLEVPGPFLQGQLAGGCEHSLLMLRSIAATSPGPQLLSGNHQIRAVIGGRMRSPSPARPVRILGELGWHSFDLRTAKVAGRVPEAPGVSHRHLPSEESSEPALELN